MKLDISPQAVCRTPLFSFQDKLAEVWDELKDCIQYSSSGFYDVIKEYTPEQLNSLDPKIKFTIWKYFNRAKYRPTPFGKFASFTLINLNLSDDKSKIEIKREPDFHQLIDWKEKGKLAPQSRKDFLKNVRSLQANNTSYVFGEEIRYIVNFDGRFGINSIEYVPIILNVIDFCSNERTLNALIEFISEQNINEQINSKSLIIELIRLQLLFTNIHPNIIGKDFFERINAMQLVGAGKPYIISERSLKSESIFSLELKIIPELLSFLNENLSDKSFDIFLEFKSAFLKKFEYKEVPLTIVMDPEMGVGYHDLTQALFNNDVIETLSGFSRKLKNKDFITYTAFHQFLLNEMLLNRTIRVETYNKEATNDKQNVANTFSAIVGFADDLLILDQAGGCTSNSLLGRFSLINRQLEQYCIRNTEIEEQANPDVIFFDISYQAEAHVDNINRRKLLNSHELPLLTWSCSNNTLSPDDILVSIQRNQIVLRSAKLGKRLIPRIASAYNYRRSDLSVYRFLCDLQHQDLNTNLNFSLKEYFPGLAHYPRVQYKQIVLSPASWLLPENFCISKNIENTLPLVKEWLKNREINFRFKAGDSDQTLCFNPTDDEDLVALLYYCQQKENVYIYEAFVPNNSVVKDETGKPYMSELIMGIQHHQTLYRALSTSYMTYDKNPDALKMPGSDWLYFEIFCHERYSNQLLVTVILPFILSIRNDILKWFFVRYNDPGPNIRLRLNAKAGVDINNLTIKLAKLLENKVLIGIISDFKISPYIRELERYGMDNMIQVEKLFKLDSEYALSILEINSVDQHCYIHSLNIVKNVMKTLNWSLQEQLNFANDMALGFSEEMNIKTEGFKVINKSFQDLLKTGFVIHKVFGLRRAKLEQAFSTTIEKAKGVNKSKLLADLFHMHVNRLFPTDQRVHEMLIYNYLKKDLERLKNRLKGQPD